MNCTHIYNSVIADMRYTSLNYWHRLQLSRWYEEQKRPMRIIAMGYLVSLQYLTVGFKLAFISMYSGACSNIVQRSEREDQTWKRGTSQPKDFIHILVTIRISADSVVSTINQTKECSQVSPSCSAVAPGNCWVRHRNQAPLRAPLSFSPQGYIYAVHGVAHEVGN